MQTTESHYKPKLYQDILRWTYSFVLVLIIPVAVLILMRKGMFKSQDYGRRRFERFGFVQRPPKQGGYLFHCVSVGEVVSASCLIKRIMSQEPEAQITVTTTTPTGSARVKDIFGDSVHHFYLPYDLHSAMAGMLRRVRPKMVLITEVELWPNLIHACWKRKIPTMVINARMTDRSAKRYAKFGALFTPMLEKLACVCAQGERDYNNFMSLGLSPNKLILTNNIKFDQAMVSGLNDTDFAFMGLQAGTRTVLVGGSTHLTEEAALFDCFRSVLELDRDALLIIVPRHPERFDEVEKLIAQTHWEYQCSNNSTEILASTQVLLINQMGRLNDAYRIGTIAFVGASLVPKGGHNALEPAAVGLPIVMGPHVFNNPGICQTLSEASALVIAQDAKALSEQVIQWVMEPQLARESGRAGRQVLMDNQGALAATLSCIVQR